MGRGLMVCLVCLLVVGCGQSKETIRIGLNDWPGYEFLYLAEQKGFFDEAGVAVDIVEFNSLSDGRRAFERGQIDALGTTVIEVIQAIQIKNRTPQIVKVFDYSDGGDVVQVRQEWGKTDLRGARIALEVGSLGAYMLDRVLEIQGVSYDEVTIVGSDQLSMQEEFASGKFDAVISYPPTSIHLERDHGARTIFSSADIPGEVVDVMAVEATVAQQRPDAIRRIIAAHDRAVAYALAGHEDAFEIMAERQGISVAEFKSALTEGLTLVGPDRQQEFLRTDGIIKDVIRRSFDILEKRQLVVDDSRLDQTFTDAYVQAAAP